jgi:hypothetical protein
MGSNRRSFLIGCMAAPCLAGAQDERVAIRNPDWLIDPTAFVARVDRGPDSREVSLSNGLLRRVFRVSPNGATVAFDNVMTGASLLRGVKPEAVLTIDGSEVSVGGLVGQPDYAYLLPEWLDGMRSDDSSFRCTGYENASVEARFPWKQLRYASSKNWPPPGAGLVFRYEAPPGTLAGLRVDVHYEMYDGIPVMAKWLVIRNESARAVRLNRFTSEILAVVEQESRVEAEPPPPNAIYVESDYTFGGMDPRGSSHTTFWVPDPQYTTQVNYNRRAPLQLESRPPLGPNVTIAAGKTLETFRTFELVYDSTERERNALARRRMYRTIAPWTSENPILMHVRQSDAASVRLAVDQCAAVGFEMVILSFGSGFDAENEDPQYRSQLRALAEYARGKGVELGGYSLLASRRISDTDDVINPQTGKTGGAIFGNSPCLGSRWAEAYFRKLHSLFETTGFRVLEHDGSYPGDVCASTLHPGHEGLEDSQWRQFEVIRDFYRWARARGIYLNVPDWYFLNGSNKAGMGYRETNWSLPRERQFILARQNIFDGTWDKTPSMGWMFVPLVQYQGGGAGATLEPLKDHLDAYEQHLAQNFGAGVQACYRGPRLYDSDETRAMVAHWVSFYKAHRAILDSDVVHLRRADGRNWDGLLHVNPALEEKGLAMLFNPLDSAIHKTIRLPLYYTGLRGSARLRVNGDTPRTVSLDDNHAAQFEASIPPRGWTWVLVEGV